MAALIHSKTCFVVTNGDRFLYFSDGQRRQYHLSNATIDNNKEKEEAGQDVTKTDSENYILAAGFSCSGKVFAVADNHKQLHLYKASPNFEHIGTRVIQRRCTALTFTHSETDVIIADRTGDVYKFSVEKLKEEGDLLLGHLSMILDVKLTSKDQYIVTCDRDEKVRISLYPTAYNIHAYCLFHTEYVSQVLYVASLDCLISGSGDGRLAAWTIDGKKLDSTTDVKYISSDDLPTEPGNHDDDDTEENSGESVAGVKKMVYDEILDLLAVIYYRHSLIHLYSLRKGQNEIKLTKESEIEVKEEPWDISFSSDQKLWVLQPCEENTVTVYSCQWDTQTSQLLVNMAENHCKEEVEYLNSNWDFFKSALTLQSHTISLLKSRTPDNMKRYLERKEERIKAEKKKLKQPDPCHGTPDKKIKTS